jgi:hypothetical protein
MTVANNGGAVGFPFPPVGIGEVSAVAAQLIADLDPSGSKREAEKGSKTSTADWAGRRSAAGLARSACRSGAAMKYSCC